MTKKLLLLICVLMLAAAGGALAEEEVLLSEQGEETAVGETAGEESAAEEPAAGETPCAVHTLVDLDETPATCTQSGMKTCQCGVCGAMVFEMLPATGIHRWLDAGGYHVCATCGFSEEHSFAENGRGHVCTVCGLMGGHSCFALADGHACALCGYMGGHDFSLLPHACSMCPHVTEHEYAADDPHVCVICGERTKHEYSGENPHECVICGFESAHNFRADAHECAVCGWRTEHVWTETAREDGGLYAPTVVRLRCSVCFETMEETQEPPGNPLDGGTASLSLSVEDGLIALWERRPGELVGAGAGMTITFELTDGEALFSGDEVIVRGGGGLAGWNVFAGRVDWSETRLRLTVLASEAAQGQDDPVEPGAAYVKLPIVSGAPSVNVLCLADSFTTEARVSVTAVLPEETGLNGGDAPYSLCGDRVALRKDGCLYEGRLGSAAFERCEDGERIAVTLNAAPCLLGGRLVFIDGDGKTIAPDEVCVCQQ